MTEHDYGPLRTYEITCSGRAPEMVQGHQVTFDSHGFFREPTGAAPKFHVHGMFPGRRWRLVLSAPEADLISIRDVTDQVAELEAMHAETVPTEPSE